MIQTLTILVATTIMTAVFHTLIPDHWLPFVLVARSRGWDTRRTAAVTATSASMHVGFSIALGLVFYLLGRQAEAAVGIGESLERLSGGLLMAFGVGYAGWFLVRGGHQHSFGMHPHHTPEVPHPASTPHPHDLRGEAASGPAGASVRGDGARTRRERLSGAALAFVVGFNPCVLVIPYIYLAGKMGAVALAAVALAFAVSTIACMVGVVVLGLKGTARIESPFLARYGEAVSGIIIAVTGLVFMLIGH